jgi:branched-chain amino acid transport system ATP-binding protein
LITSKFAIETQDLHKHFGGVYAVHGVSIEVGKGEFRAIIGPNGAGKSTLFNVMTGLLKANSGKVVFDGEDITGLPPHLIYHKGIGRTFQITAIFKNLTVFENVQVAVLSYLKRTLNIIHPARRLAREKTFALLEAVNLNEEGEKLAGTLSQGDQKRLELAIALTNQPRLLMLDEPTAGMAAQERIQSIKMIRRIAEAEKITVLFIEHDMDVVFSVSDKITVMHRGEVLTEGTPQEIRCNEEVQRIYLGEAPSD